MSKVVGTTMCHIEPALLSRMSARKVRSPRRSTDFFVVLVHRLRHSMNHRQKDRAILNNGVFPNIGDVRRWIITSAPKHCTHFGQQVDALLMKSIAQARTRLQGLDVSVLQWTSEVWTLVAQRYAKGPCPDKCNVEHGVPV